jgi:hypothetical protein
MKILPIILKRSNVDLPIGLKNNEINLYIVISLNLNS